MPAHMKSSNSQAPIAVIGIDIGKNVFHLIGLDKRGAIVLKCKLSRSQLVNRLANLPPCLIGMEACVGSHHLSRRLAALGGIQQKAEKFHTVNKWLTRVSLRKLGTFVILRISDGLYDEFPSPQSALNDDAGGTC
jgi:hypothetical protein